MSKTAYIFLADGFEDIEGLTVVDLLRRAGIDIKTVSIKETTQIRTSHGITMLTDITFAETDFTDADILVLPGGMPGTRYLASLQTTHRPPDRLQQQRQKNRRHLRCPKRILRTRLSQRQKSHILPIIHGSHRQRRCPVPSEDSVVVDGNITTSRGLGTAIDFALSIIEQLEGTRKKQTK